MPTSLLDYGTGTNKLTGKKMNSILAREMAEQDLQAAEDQLKKAKKVRNRAGYKKDQSKLYKQTENFSERDGKEIITGGFHKE